MELKIQALIGAGTRNPPQHLYPKTSTVEIATLNSELGRFFWDYPPVGCRAGRLWPIRGDSNDTQRGKRNCEIHFLVLPLHTLTLMLPDVLVVASDVPPAGDIACRLCSKVVKACCAAVKLPDCNACPS